MADCIFCKMVKKEIPTSIVYEDDDILAFRDIAPKAPVHVLIIPKKHISDMSQICEQDASIIGKIHLAAVKIAKELGVAETGFRLVNNCLGDSGQEVMHIHYHLVGGRPLGDFCSEFSVS